MIYYYARLLYRTHFATLTVLQCMNISTLNGIQVKKVATTLLGHLTVVVIEISMVVKFPFLAK